MMMMSYRWFGISASMIFAAACTKSGGGGAVTAGTQAQTAAAATAAPAPTGTPVIGKPGAPHAPETVNPFEGARLYIDPDYVKQVAAAASAAPAHAATLKKVEAFSTAIWLDSIARAGQVSHWLDDAAKQQGTGKPVVTVFVVYDMPNRDCSAKSSAGELAVEDRGEERYKAEFIDKIAAQFAAHGSQRIVAILEPDSLPNIATNLNVPKCAASEQAYRRSTAYAIAKLAMPNVFLYLDAAHAGWLGWEGNRTKIADIFKDVLHAAGGAEKIRGFATNVSNYNILRGDDGKKLEPSNPCPDELTYVQKLGETLGQAGIANKAFIIDTSRNGRGGIRTKWGSWCNVKGAGLGERPRAAPAPLIDAYYWVKPPGQSDGSANASEPRFDANCASPDASPGAPQAGTWFQSQFLELVEHANPPL
jgi:cellulose 1,4-beta-cellobiosidase